MESYAGIFRILQRHALIITLLLCTGRFYEFCNCYQAGAPTFSCKTMTPGHSSNPQTSPSRYSVVTKNAEVGSLQPITVQINSQFNDQFTGYLLQARPSRSEDAFGTFISIPEGSSTLNCGAVPNSAVTHKDKRAKRSIQAVWEAPSDYEGNAIFIATVVQNYSVYWTGIESLPIHISKRSAAGGAEPFENEESKRLKAIERSLYDGCGSTKNCIGSTENCIANRDCTAIATILAEGGSYLLEMMSKKGQYVAAALSNDTIMGADAVFDCVYEGNSVEVYRSYNQPNLKSNIRLQDNAGISKVQSRYLNGQVYCKIKLDPVIYVYGTKFDLNVDKYYVLLAAGSSLHANGVGYHDLVVSASRDKRQLSDLKTVEVYDAFYEGCGVTKNCFGSPSGCVQDMNCKAVTAVIAEGDRFLIEMQAKDAKYVATGLSDDRIMANDSVVECVDDNSGLINAYRSWNVPNDKNNVRIESDGIEFISGRVVDNVLKCKLYLDKATRHENPLLDITGDSYFLMIASGSKLKSGLLQFHDLVYSVSNKPISLAEVSSQSTSQNRTSSYEGCDISKSCFGYPAGCINSPQACRAFTSISFNKDYFTFELEAVDAAYVAVGLSDDAEMGDDSVVECVQDSNNNVKMYLSWNHPGEKNNSRITSQKVVNFQSGNVVDGKLHCVGTHATDYEINGKAYNLTKKSYILLLAAGNLLRSGGVGYHDILFTMSAEKRILTDVAEFSAASKLFLYLHGSFMVVAWIGTASLGIILARYFKQTWIGNSICGKDIWFAWHRFFMVITWILTLSSVIIMYVDVGGFVTGPSQTHALLGTITTVLAFIQPIGAAFRPHPESSRRSTFNWLHWFMGNAAHIIAIVTIFLAVDLSKAELPKWTDILLAAYVGVYVITHLILSILGCLSEKSGGIRINSFPMKDISPNRNQPAQYERRKDAAYSGLRKFILFIYALAVIAFCVLFILLIIKGSIF